jgi:translation initiation factor IF-2
MANKNRPPVVVILGHVDHGKTTLLDYLRKSHVAAREAGGITQHIRSFQLTLPDSSSVTFIDTPGHAAFAQMRSRGSRVADIAILVVAADDGVMPQTRESIQFIKQAGVPFIVAINKIDLSSADPDRVKTQLTESDVVVEDYGGNVPVVGISAKTGQGIPDLLELINLLAQLAPPQADPEGELEAWVLESRLDPQRGPMAVVIVKNGTLSAGQSLYQTASIGKARALIGSDGQPVKTALPSMPVEILGLSQIPAIGSQISSHPVFAAPVATPLAVKASGTVNVVLRADVAGSLEAILAALDPQVNVLSAGTGDVTENDIYLARASKARIIGFNVRVPNGVAKLAEIEKIPVQSFKIIYELLDALTLAAHPKATEVVLGKCSVLAEFKIGPDRIAGCRCIEGQISKGDMVRVVRENSVLGTSKIKNLQTGKTLIDKVKPGQEFGLTLGPYLDFKTGDTIIAFSTISNL